MAETESILFEFVMAIISSTVSMETATKFFLWPITKKHKTNEMETTWAHNNSNNILKFHITTDNFFLSFFLETILRHVKVVRASYKVA